MGADMIGFLAKGPVSIKSKREEALKAAGTIQDILKRWRDLEDPESGEPDPEAIEAFIKEYPITRYQFDEEWEFAERYSLLDPEKVFDALVDVWESGARDVMTRLDPDDRNQQIWAAGDMSWGDEPDGYGYETYRDAMYLGMTVAVGIR